MAQKAQTIAQALASAVIARANCIQSDNTEWRDRWERRIQSLVRDHMPSGSGIDTGTTIDLDRSSAEALRFTFSFHHMNENGYYDGWTDHVLIVRPDWSGVALKITGRDRNDTKGYLYQTYDYALSLPAPELTAED